VSTVADPLPRLVQGSDGNFYGTTSSGGPNLNGTVFKITPAGVMTMLYAFTGGGTDGSNSTAALIQGSDGNFYGTTTSGGPSYYGTVFMITPTGGGDGASNSSRAGPLMEVRQPRR